MGETKNMYRMVMEKYWNGRGSNLKEIRTRLFPTVDAGISNVFYWWTWLITSVKLLSVPGSHLLHAHHVLSPPNGRSCCCGSPNLRNSCHCHDCGARSCHYASSSPAQPEHWANTQTQLHHLVELQLARDCAQTTSPPLEKQTILAQLS
jgi:hypothetical protein